MKPKIYATCKAGCQWETIHKDDFARIASHIEVQPYEPGKFRLEIGKEYVIYSDLSYMNNFAVEIYIDGFYGETASVAPFEPVKGDEYAKKFTFCLLHAELTSDGEISVVYDVNGERKTELLGAAYDSFSEQSLRVESATAVYEYNEHATVVIPGKEEVVEQITEECKAYVDEAILGGAW